MNTIAKKIIFYFLLPITLLALPFLVPPYQVSFDVATLLTIISLLYAILAGFFIATATNNYLRLQSLMAQENGGWIALFSTGIFIEPAARKKFAETIDRYLIASLNFELSEYIEKTEKTFERVLATVHEIKLPDEKSLTMLPYLHELKSQLIMSRQEIPLVARQIVSKQHWIVLITLASLIIVLLLVIRNDHLLATVISSILGFTAYLVLVLLYEIDSNSFAEEKLAFENAQILFRALGMVEYYPAYAILQKRVHPKKPYRTGSFEDPSDPRDVEIKLVT